MKIDHEVFTTHEAEAVRFIMSQVWGDDNIGRSF